MAEARLTETLNLASLDAYQKLELEKKKKVSVKNIIKGPLIRYHSLAMPILDTEDEAETTTAVLADAANAEKQSRNFITFTDEQVLREIFPSRSTKQAALAAASAMQKLKICAVTGLPARYFDPLTQLPYANLYAFKALRQIHAKESGKNKS